MKTRQLFLAFLFLVSSIVTFAQTSFTSAGIAVQGIARDNNTAIQNESITFDFAFYYEDAAGAKKPYSKLICS